MDIIISAATHRSGSTLLQRVFNIRKETLIWGEQDGMITKFHHMHKSLKHYSENLVKQRLDYFNNNEDPNHWIACMNPEMEYVDKAITESIQVLLETLYSQNLEGHDLIGFKEVRYGEEELALLRRCYPDAKIVLLVRNPIDVWKSMLGAGLGQNVTNFTKKWVRNAEAYLKIANNDPLSFLVKYEDLVGKEGKTIETIAEIGRMTDKDIEEVLVKKIWSTPRPVSPSIENLIKKECGATMKKYGYII